MIRHETHTIQDSRAPFSFMSFHLFPFASHLNRPGNWHEDLEIISLKEGIATVYIGDRIFTAKAGDTVIFNSNLIHSIIPCDGPVSYDCLIVHPSFTSDNCMDIFSIQFRPFIKNDEKLFLLMEDLRKVFPGPHSSSFTLKEENRKLKFFLPQRAAILRILSHLYCSHLVSKNVSLSNKTTNENIKRALEFIHANIHRDLSLDEVAEVVGLNSCYFSREFRRVTQITFVSYVNQVRCECAKHYLKKDQFSIAEISKQCGFSDQAYFSRTFLRIEGITPSEYQKRSRRSTKN